MKVFSLLFVLLSPLAHAEEKVCGVIAQDSLQFFLASGEGIEQNVVRLVPLSSEIRTQLLKAAPNTSLCVEGEFSSVNDQFNFYVRSIQ